jgi:Arc/MetJ family transcription regulator
MDDAEYDEIQEAADARRLTMSAWVRQTLRTARAHDDASPPEGRGSGAAPGASASHEAHDPHRSATPNPDLVRQVMQRHGLATPAEALDFALRRAAEFPLFRSDMLSLRGTGWSGDLAKLRANPGATTGSDEGSAS